MTNTARDPLAPLAPNTATAKLPLAPDADDAWVDEALAPFQAFVSALAATAEPLGGESVGMRTFIESLRVFSHLRVSLPFEMDVLVGDSGYVRLAGGPPACYTETSVRPVFHQLTLRVEGEAAHG